MCKERPKAKNVTIAITVDGKTTKQQFECSQILAASKLPIRARAARAAASGVKPRRMPSSVASAK